MDSAITSCAGSDEAEILTRLFALDDKVRTRSKSLRNILSKFLERPTQERHVASNAIAELEEHWSERALRSALEELDIHEYSLEYNSSYNGKSPRNESNDKGADLVLKLPDGRTEIPFEVEQRKRGYTTKSSYETEVGEKLPQNGVYTWFNGYEREQFNQVRVWSNIHGIRVVSLEPLPYQEVKKNEYLFDIGEIIVWLNKTFSQLKAAYIRHLRAILQEANEDNDPTTMTILMERRNDIDDSPIRRLWCVSDAGRTEFRLETLRFWPRFDSILTLLREKVACIPGKRGNHLGCTDKQQYSTSKMLCLPQYRNGNLRHGFLDVLQTGDKT